MQCTICGNPVHQYEDITKVFKNKEYHFCSDEHSEEFEQSPNSFIT